MAKVLKFIREKSNISSYILFGLYIVLLFFIIKVTPTEHIGFEANDIYPMNQGWTIIENDVEILGETLPFQSSLEVGMPVSIKRTLPKAFRYGQTIRLRSSMEEVRVRLKGQLIYDNTTYINREIPFSAEGSHWVFIDIPTGNDGSGIEIEFRSDIPGMSGTVNRINYGSRGDLIIQLIEARMVSLLVVIFVLGVAIFAFIVSLSAGQLETVRLNYLSLFALTMGIWIFSEIDILQLFVKNSYVIGTISYLILPISAVTFILYIKEVVLGSYRKYLNGLAYTICLYLSLSIVLQSVFGVHYFRVWFIFMFELLVLVVTVVVLLAKEYLKGNKSAGKYLISMSALMLTVVIEVIMFLNGYFNQVSSLSKVGIAIFLLFLVVDTLNFLNRMIQKEGENRYLRTIAYQDTLTGGSNRAAFEKEIDRILSLEVELPFRLTMFDLNNLKKINDNFGHAMGDNALKSFYKCISDVYRDTGRCYRIGGDEFMVIQEDTSDVLFIESISSMKAFMSDNGEAYDFKFSVAYGTDVYNYDKSFGEFKHGVDQKMYEEKKRSKSTEE